MIYSEKKFLMVIEESFKKYKEFGARSTEKLKPLHKYIAEILKDIWGNEFEIHYLGNASKEFKVSGKYYDKNVDICVTKNNKPVFCLGIKFVTSNYKQNANNYFENMMGETANIQSIGDLPYAQLIILRHETPYYLKNETEIPSKIEIVNDKDISKYLKLIFDVPQAHRPNQLGIQIINLDEENCKVAPTKLAKAFSKEVAILLENKVSLSNFFNEITNYKNYFNSPK